MVDQLGGIDVCLPKAAKEHDSGIDLPAGRSHVQGDQALAFVRQRKKLPNGDLDRIARQQQFLGAVIRKVLSAGTLLNPLRLNGFLKVATSSLQVDEDLQVSDLRDLALRFRCFSAGGVLFTTIPITTHQRQQAQRRRAASSRSCCSTRSPTTRCSAACATTSRPATPAHDADGAPPARCSRSRRQRIRVEVLNGAGVPGLGRKAATDLSRARLPDRRRARQPRPGDATRPSSCTAPTGPSRPRRSPRRSPARPPSSTRRSAAPCSSWSARRTPAPRP